MIGENRWIATISLGICTLFTSFGWMYMRFPHFYEKYVFGISSAIWLLSAYIIAEVSMVILAGVMVDRIGSRNTMAIGTTLFVAGSMGAYVANSFELIVLQRVIQGLGAGFIFTVGVAFIPKMFDKSKRPDPHKVVTLAFSLGSIFGTAVGYYFLFTLNDWKLFMLISAIVVFVFGVLGCLTLCQKQREMVRDIPGLILSVTTVASIMTYTQTVNVYFDLLSMESLAFIEFCVIQLFLLIYVERKTPTPILPLGIKRTHIGLLAGMFMAGFCGLGMLQFLAMFLLAYYKLSLYSTVGIICFIVIGGACTSLIGMTMIYKIGIRPMAIAGPIIIMIGFIGAYFLLTKGIVFVAISLFVIGMGFGLIVTEMVLSIQASTPVKDVGAYTAMLMAVRFVGIILGMSVYDHFILGPVRDGIRSIKGMETIDLLDWLLNHSTEGLEQILSLFEKAVQDCCIAAAIMVLSALIISIIFIGKDDLNMPERNE